MGMREEGQKMVEILVDGKLVEVPVGCSVAYALLHCGISNSRLGRDQIIDSGVFCGMGSCFECSLSIDGVPAQRSCIISVRDGMRIDTRKGESL